MDEMSLLQSQLSLPHVLYMALTFSRIPIFNPFLLCQHTVFNRSITIGVQTCLNIINLKQPSMEVMSHFICIFIFVVHFYSKIVVSEVTIHLLWNFSTFILPSTHVNQTAMSTTWLRLFIALSLITNILPKVVHVSVFISLDLNNIWQSIWLLPSWNIFFFWLLWCWISWLSLFPNGLLLLLLCSFEYLCPTFKKISVLCTPDFWEPLSLFPFF